MRLRFKRWLSVEQAPFDLATISVNGQQVWQNPTAAHLVDTSWQVVEYALPMADKHLSGIAADAAAFPVQAAVVHGEFGDGVVTDVEDDRLTVLFNDVGYRTLSLAVVEEEGLLRRVDD